MVSDDSTNFLPTIPPERQPPQANRTVLGALTLLVVVAVILALWFLVFDGDDSSDPAGGGASSAGPTPVTVPTSTPTPVPAVVIAGDETETGTATGTVAVPTPVATIVPTPIPDGFEACGPERAPTVTTTYIVDTQTTPLNQRSEPSVAAELAGSYEPGTTGLVFTGDCVVNIEDGYVWWQIDNGTTEVWVASEFVTPN